MLDFYSNLDKNVAYGAEDARGRKPKDQAKLRSPETQKEGSVDISNHDQHNVALEEVEPALGNTSSALESSLEKNEDHGETSIPSKISINPSDLKPNSEAPVEGKTSVQQSSDSQPKPDHHKRSQDALAAAKERFLSRKKTKEQ